MTALNGTVDEWKQGEDGLWRRLGHPEDGDGIWIDPVIFPTFEDYYNKRASDPQTPEEEMQAVKLADPNARIAALEARLAALEQKG